MNVNDMPAGVYRTVISAAKEEPADPDGLLHAGVRLHLRLEEGAVGAVIKKKLRFPHGGPGDGIVPIWADLLRGVHNLRDDQLPATATLHDTNALVGHPCFIRYNPRARWLEPCPAVGKRPAYGGGWTYEIRIISPDEYARQRGETP